MQKLEMEWRELKRTTDAIVREGENKYDEATKDHERAIAAFEASGEDPRLAPKKTAAYVVSLQSLGRLYALMSDYDRAERFARKGWITHNTVYGASRSARIRNDLALAEVLYTIDKPHDAAQYVDNALLLCAEVTAEGYQPKENSLLAECLLKKAEIANRTGQHHAAEDVAKRALDLFKKTGSERNPNVAAALYSLAIASIRLDKIQESSNYLDLAKAILEQHHVRGHPTLAAIHISKAQVHFVRDEKSEALNAAGKALAEFDQLFPLKTYPRGHPDQIRAMTSLGDLYDQYGRHADALDLHQKAWRKCQAFYPKAHRNKLSALLCYGRSLRSNGKLPEALARFTDAEAIARELHAKADSGDLALCLIERGITEAQADDQQALHTLQKALALHEKLRPQTPAPISGALFHLGEIHFKQGDTAKARVAFSRALTSDQLALAQFAGIAAEAEALAFAGRRQQSFHAFLAASRGLDDGYEFVWTAKATVTRLLQKRRAIARIARDESVEVRRLLDQLIDTRTRIGSLIRSSHESERVRDTLPELLKSKERLERDLATLTKAFGHLVEGGQRRPAQLAERLPTGSVFVDLVQYESLLDEKSGAPHYVAFVLTPSATPMRVELGAAAPIDNAVQEWRQSLQHWSAKASPAVRDQWQRKSDEQAATLRRLLWEPIARRFPAHTRLVYLAPDGSLAQFPFAALPGKKDGTIVLEECLIAYVPHGPFLLDQLLNPAPADEAPGQFLALGAVAYGPEDGGFRFLPHTATEIQEAQHAAGANDSVILQRDEATRDALCAALPKVRWAHLATHGFFAATDLAAEHARLADHLRAWDGPADGAPRSIGLGRRSPLSYTGLALAGANGARSGGRRDGILTGETIAELPLDRLRLVVLSACETGLGESAGGEGVHGLQRAFHLAGCPNVVATLWQVDDNATRILMTDFYRQQRALSKSPLEALSLAQLKLYGDAELTGGAAKRSHATYWAGFVYFGGGVPLSVLPSDPQFGRPDEPAPLRAVAYWGVGCLLLIASGAAVVAIRRRRRYHAAPLPVATILGPADAAEPNDLGATQESPTSGAEKSFQ